MKNIIILLFVLLLILTARTGPDFIAWDWGGWDAEIGPFLCPASGYYDAAGNWHQDWRNPLYDYIPALFTDC